MRERRRTVTKRKKKKERKKEKNKIIVKKIIWHLFKGEIIRRSHGIRGAHSIKFERVVIKVEGKAICLGEIGGCARASSDWNST